MSARTAALLVALAVCACACALPDSKLISAKKSVTQPSKDAGLDGGSDAGDAASDAQPDAGTAERSTAGAGGMRPPSKAESGAGAAGMRASNKPGSAPLPKAKGELCRGNEDCVDANCKTAENGERRCFGSLKVDQTCTEPYDCDGYSCVPLTPKGKTSVCVDKAACPAQGTCFEDYGVAMCQLDQQCGAKAGSFNECYRRACTLAGKSNAECLAVLPAEKSLNESACCPSGGALNGSCNTATQCGCGDGMKCDIDGESAKAVCLRVGQVAPGGSCALPDDCTKSYGCIGGVCKRYCGGTSDTSCEGGASCNPLVAQTTSTAAFYCTRLCDPLSPASTEQPFLGCAEGDRCNPAPDGHTDCSRSGSIPAGSPCDDGTGRVILNGCAPASFCVKAPNPVCAPLCRVGRDDCESGTCRAFEDGHYYVLQTEVGYCAAP